MELTRLLRSLEFIRRLGAALLLIAAAACFFYVSLSPLITLKRMDFAREKEHPSFPSFSHDSAAITLPEYIARKTEGRLIRAEGAEWRRVFDAIFAASGNSQVPAGLQEHVSPGEEDQRYVERNFFFRPEDLPPVPASRGAAPEELYLVSQGAEGARYLRLWHHTYTDDDFHLGVGLSTLPPPVPLLYPLRKFAPWFALLALLLYVCLPWPRREPDDLYILRTRIVLSDFLSFVLFFMFFVLPFFIVGGLFQTLRGWWGLCSLVWPLAMLGALLFKYAAWYSAYKIKLRGDRIEVHTAVGTEEFLLSDVTSYGQVIKTMPAWLTWGSAAGALVQGSPGSAGRALLAWSASYTGYVLNLRAGTRLFIWASDQTGNSILEGEERLWQSLDAAGAAKVEQPVVVSTIGLEHIEGPESSGRNKRLVLENSLIIFGPSLLAILFGLGAGS